MHPAVGLLLERLVPKGGAEVEGVLLPEGTIVGMNPWVAARDKAVYGPDAYEFKPERWLEADEKQLKLMERNSLAVSNLLSSIMAVVLTPYSSVLATVRAWARTSHCWRCQSSYRSCSGSSTSN